MALHLVRILVLVLVLLALAGIVSADGGINGAPNGYFGGDSFFCSSARGCWLLNSNSPANGSVPVLLGEFAQADIQAALEKCAAEGHNVAVGTIQGTYGPFTLSAVYDGPNADPVCSLQINAFEGEGKEAKPYVFKPIVSGGYSPIGISVDLSADCYLYAHNTASAFLNAQTSTLPIGSGNNDGYDLFKYDSRMPLGIREWGRSGTYEITEKPFEK